MPVFDSIPKNCKVEFEKLRRMLCVILEKMGVIKERYVQLVQHEITSGEKDSELTIVQSFLN